MLKNEPSFASLHIKQSLAMYCAHVWIMRKDGKRWHPCGSQDALLTDLFTIQQWKPWLLKVLQRLFN
ncbi:phage filamentation protein Fil family protein [Enterobacter sp.]|uniref:phage filamentation protein Fil family protein n=1 Tax=Enterobacter sp. TaxID=42895 RepID=UPI00296FD6F6|nr:phage filamentation protein Fil family protein [Enterobacter sp.]